MGIKIDFSEIEELQKMVEGLIKKERDPLLKKITNELAARVLAGAIKRTPVSNSRFEEISKIGSNGKIDRWKRGKNKGYAKTQVVQVGTGGTLRRGWNATEAVVSNGGCEAFVNNPIKYAPYVEFGHRQRPGRFVPAIGKRLKASFVKGRFMLTKSVESARRIRMDIIRKHLVEYMKKGGFDVK